MNFTLNFSNMIVHISKRNFRFLFEIIVFDKSQSAISSRSSNAMSHSLTDHVFLSETTKSRLKNLQNTDIVVSNS